MSRSRTSTRFTIAGATVLASFSFAAAAMAGTVMELTTREMKDPKAKPTTQVIAIQDGRIRMEQAGHTEFTIFRDETVYHVDTADKTYTKIDRAQMEQLSGQLAGMRKQMEERMAQMPPEQRKMMEEAMSRMGAGAAVPGAAKSAPPVTTRDTGRNETVNGYSCRIWEVSINDRKESDFCVAAPTAVPGGTDVYKAMQQMGEIAKRFTQDLGAMGIAQGAWSELQKINGVPVLMRDYDESGKLDSETRLTSAKTQSVPASSFDVPAGFKENKLGK